jgi:DNA gyrase subunit A
VIGMVCIEDTAKESVLVVSEKGYGKRSDIEDYRVTNRGGKGVKTLQITDKTGQLVGIKSVIDGDDLMIITRKGTTIRIPVDGLRVMGRATQGVKLIRLDDEDAIASVAKVEEHLLKADPSELAGETDTNDSMGTENSQPQPENDSETNTNQTEPTE